MQNYTKEIILLHYDITCIYFLWNSTPKKTEKDVLKCTKLNITFNSENLQTLNNYKFAAFVRMGNYFWIMLVGNNVQKSVFEYLSEKYDKRWKLGQFENFKSSTRTQF